MEIDTGDTIYHRPSGERWLVAYAEAGRVVCCGWPCSMADADDCELVTKASPAERDDLLNRMANMREDDPRKRYAAYRLQKESPDE